MQCSAVQCSEAQHCTVQFSLRNVGAPPVWTGARSDMPSTQLNWTELNWTELNCTALHSTVHCTWHCIEYTALLYSVHCAAQYTLHCSVNTALYSLQCTLQCTVYSAAYFVHCTLLCSVHCTVLNGRGQGTLHRETETVPWETEHRLFLCSTTSVEGKYAGRGFTLHCSRLHCITVYCSALQWSLLDYIALQSTALHCTAVASTALQ